MTTATATHHNVLVIPVRADRQEYGIRWESVYVFRNPRSGAGGGYPTRIVVWDNTGRPNARNGERVRFGQYGPIDGGDGQYLDPQNKATDSAETILVSTESFCISAHGNGTGTRASGQVWAPDNEALRDGDTVTMVRFDGEKPVGPQHYRVVIGRHNNGHGHLEPIAEATANTEIEVTR